MLLVIPHSTHATEKTVMVKEKDGQRLTEQRSAQIPGCDRVFEPAAASYDFLGNLNPALPDNGQVGRVYITRLPIFDEQNPRENNALFRFANRFHTLTREYVVRDLVLFEEGQSVDKNRLEESARILRQQKYLYDANVMPVRQCNNTLDIEIVTKDVWSFNPEISYQRSGGVAEYRFAVRDTNILGTGKLLALATKKNLERTATELIYKDPNIAGSRMTTRLEYSDNDDGSNQHAGIGLPFYSLDSRRSWRLVVERIDRTDTQYFHGQEVTEIQHEINDYIFNWGFSNGLVDGETRRWQIGYRYRKDRFLESNGLLPPPPLPPQSKQYAYPFFAFEFVENHYAKTFDVDQIHRTEDLHLGNRFYVRAGYATNKMDADQDRFIIDGEGSQAIYYSGDSLLRHQFQWTGMWNQDTRKTEDFLLKYEMRYYKGQTKHRSFAAILNAAWSKNLNTGEQVYVGGETGLRGYEARFQTGDRKLSLNLEERMYSDKHLLNLLRLGWAVFVDVGRAWEPGLDNGSDNEWLVNAGLGLRLASSKADAGKIIHMDLAWPLTRKDDPAVDSYQFWVTIKEAF